MDFSTTLTSFSTGDGILVQISNFLEPFGQVASAIKSMLGLIK
ncbi:hypothetical protein [Corynebacterium meridianum]|nr:hypothetical protein [Corynebacterium meridianum]